MSIRFVLAAFALAVTTTACATLPAATPLLMTAEPVAIVMATAIISPEALIAVVSDAVKAAPESAVLIASAAAAAAPDQALAIRAVAVQAAPLLAEGIVRVTSVKRRHVAARVKIPDAADMLALLERAAPVRAAPQ